jgi:hypothetical protein
LRNRKTRRAISATPTTTPTAISALVPADKDFVFPPLMGVFVPREVFEDVIEVVEEVEEEPINDAVEEGEDVDEVVDDDTDPTVDDTVANAVRDDPAAATTVKFWL